MRQEINSRSGYTLIELSIVLLVLGTLAGSAMMAYNIYYKKKAIDTTVSNTSLVTEAIGNYLIQQGRYPCPARADLDRTDADYGMEGDCDDTTQAVGICTNGICIEESQRTFSALGAGGVPGGTSPSTGTMCVTINENQTMKLTAPGGGSFTSVTFASYGTPAGSCGSYTTSACHAAGSSATVSATFVGSSSATITANNATFGDPCAGTAKKLTVQLEYGGMTTADTLSAGAGMPAWLSGATYACGGTGSGPGGLCNYPEYLTYLYTGTPSINCPTPESTMMSGWGGTLYDLCSVAGMRDYFNSFGLGSWLSSTSTPLAVVGVAPRVRRGVVPFRVLNLPEEFSEDGYRMKIEYAVTEHLAVAESYEKTQGGISVIDHTGKSLVSPDASAHFVVVSHGPDKTGAFNRYGRQGLACPAGTMDEENCNTTTDSDAVYRLAQGANADNASHFDDTVKFFTSVDTPLWKVADASGFHVHDLVEAGLPGGGKVGIKTSTPSETVEVKGDINSQDDLMLNELCDSTGADCLQPEMIAGDEAAMDCTDPAHPAYDATKPYAVGFAGGRVVCSDVVEFKCPSGQMMTGIAADGSLTCQTIVPCPTRPETVCVANDATLPVGLQGQNAALSAGASRIENWQCNAGTWTFINATGVCTCVPVNANSNLLCDSVLNGGWAGNVVRNTTTVCPSGVTTITDDTSACSCVPDSETRVVTCPTGFVGSKTEQRDWICDTATTGHWTAWSVIGGSCTCNPSSQTKSLTCPAAHTGIWQQQKDFTCPAATWGAWYDIVKTCTCTGATANQTVACGTGFVGTKTQTRTYDCPNNIWGPWVDVDTSACYAISYYWKAKVAGTAQADKPPGPQDGSACSVLGDTTACWGYKAGGGYYAYANCACE